MKATVRSGRAMGSSLRLTIPGLDGAAADAAWAIVRRTFADAERDLTRFDPRSALSQLNGSAGAPRRVSPPLGGALVAAWRAFRVSGGRFDPRIIGALEAAGERAGVALPPSPARLDPNDRWLCLDLRRGLTRVTAPIDLGGIGKGLALRWTRHRLRAAGFGDFLVTAGGDLVAAGTGPAGLPWMVALEDPGAPGTSLATIELREGGLATSSIAVHPNHLIDPATLRPASSPWASVTVTAADPAWAEVWSKVGFLAGDRIGEVLAGRSAWWVDSTTGVIASTGRMSPPLTTVGTVERAAVGGG